MRDFLNELRAVSGTKEKIALLRSMIEEDENTAIYFNMALNPYKTYGVKKIPDDAPSFIATEKYSLPIIFEKVEQLSKLNRSNKTLEVVDDILAHSENIDTISRLILKDVDCGISVANFNKAIPDNLLEKYKIMDYPCCLISSDINKASAKFNWEEGVICQEKCDGMRFNAIVSGKTVEFFGRSGKPITILSESFEQEFKDLASSFDGDLVFDGELLVENDGEILDRKTGNGILNKAVRGTIGEKESDMIVATLWDIIPKELFVTQTYKKFESPEYEYESRFKRLEDMRKLILFKDSDFMFKKIRLVDSQIVYSLDEAYDAFKIKLSQGKEGVILKSKHSYWKNTRLTDCVKLKDIRDCDLVVSGYLEGTGKYKGKLGALMCESSDGKLVVNVGTGFSDEERETFTKETAIGKIVTVQYNAVIEDKKTKVKSLFLPRFVEFRSDKDVADTYDKICGG